MKILMILFLLISFSFSIEKDEFIDKFKEVIDIENFKIQEEREIVSQYFDKKDDTLFKDILHLKSKYKISSVSSKEEFFKKIDTIPISLVLSQCAIESKWGESIFSQKFNNFFGMKNKKGKFAKFTSLQENIYEYMINLNTHPSYKNFRDKRYKFKKEGRIFDGIEASSTLTEYSESSHDYVKLIKQVIHNHDLLLFDKEEILVKNEEREVVNKELTLIELFKKNPLLLF